VLALALTGGLAALGVRLHDRQETLDRNTEGLTIATSSDMVAVRLVAAPGVAADAHGEYRSSPSHDLALLTASHFAPAPSGQVYQAWAEYQGRWESVGVLDLNTEGHALLFVKQHGRGTPQALQITLEPSGGSTAPSGTVIVAWTAG
jgi:anti-sigma-K factor RskA